MADARVQGAAAAGDAPPAFHSALLYGGIGAALTLAAGYQAEAEARWARQVAEQQAAGVAALPGRRRRRGVAAPPPPPGPGALPRVEEEEEGAPPPPHVARIKVGKTATRSSLNLPVAVIPALLPGVADCEALTLISATNGRSYRVVYHRQVKPRQTIHTLVAGWRRFAHDHVLRLGDVLELTAAADPAGAGAGGGGGGRRRRRGRRDPISLLVRVVRARDLVPPHMAPWPRSGRVTVTAASVTKRGQLSVRPAVMDTVFPDSVPGQPITLAFVEAGREGGQRWQATVTRRAPTSNGRVLHFYRTLVQDGLAVRAGQKVEFLRQGRGKVGDGLVGVRVV
jgi:hypothetical protein